MRYQKLDMNLLVALDALLDDPHVTRVADRLNVTQSAMSGSLSRLREYFADELIIQSGKRASLTALGNELREPVRELLSLTDRLLATKASFDPAVSERVYTLYCSDYVWVTLISDLVIRLQSVAPNIRLEYLDEAYGRNSGHADFVVTPPRAASTDFRYAPLLVDPLVCIAWAKNDQLDDGLTKEAFFRLSHIKAHSPYPDVIDDWVTQKFDQRTVFAVKVPSAGIVPMSIVGTQHIAIVPLRTAKRYAAFLPIRIIPSELPFPVTRLMLQWHSHHEADDGLRWFRSLMLEMGNATELRPIEETIADA